MQLKYGAKLFLLLVVFSLLVSTGFCASSYDRELIVQDKTRAMQVESVFKQMMAAYEDEDARGFLDHVSDERFRQDYITFTDALYSDFRNYEIHQVDYWIDKVVPDNVKQFLFVHWEKRYENLDDGRQLTQKGVSRFLFDEVEGDYLLVELAGNHLFGGSLLEWTQEVPQISGQEVTAQVADIPTAVVTTTPTQADLWISNVTYTPYDSMTIELIVTIENRGLAASTSCQLDLAVPSRSENIESINPGDSVTATFISVPPSGSLTIDALNEVVESDESNNDRSFEFPY